MVLHLVSSLLLLLNTALPLLAVHSAKTCYSPQYLELGNRGSIDCPFEEDYSRVMWYSSNDYINNSPMLQYNKLLKSGLGYDSGEFDVLPDGSLVINEVTVKHEGVFTGIYAHASKEGSIIRKIRVIVVAKAKIRFPNISNCRGNASNICYSKIDLPVKCSVQDVRPALNLKFIARTLEGDKNLRNNITVKSGKFGYSSEVTTQDAFYYSTVLALLVCKASGPQTVLEEYESMILAERKHIDLSRITLIMRSAECNSNVVLSCTNKSVGFLVWKRATSIYDSKISDLLFYVSMREKRAETFVDGIMVDDNGALVVPKLHAMHKGVYVCIFSDGLTELWRAYEVEVTDDCNVFHHFYFLMTWLTLFWINTHVLLKTIFSG